MNNKAFICVDGRSDLLRSLCNAICAVTPVCSAMMCDVCGSVEFPALSVHQCYLIKVLAKDFNVFVYSNFID